MGTAVETDSILLESVPLLIAIVKDKTLSPSFCHSNFPFIRVSPKIYLNSGGSSRKRSLKDLESRTILLLA
ncbi:hypothetical protein L1049_018255 [Liquidambar formosana]|uniref:Uncharacterized protein n=1 Tax=Liquidambar formosana TaxID=63359 RepID=A0AAP0WML0_LIQFO